MRKTALRADLGVRAHDRYCPADFNDALPMTASLPLLLDIGIAAIAEHDQALVDLLVDGVTERFG